MSNKDLTIHLKIKTLRVPVTERMPVIVIWSRQSKQAKTKKRLLSDQVDTTVFDEDFQISTNMTCDENGTPTKPKMVRQKKFVDFDSVLMRLVCFIFSHN